MLEHTVASIYANAITVMRRAPLIYIENILIRGRPPYGRVYPRAFAHNAISYGCLRCLIHFELNCTIKEGRPVANADATGKKGWTKDLATHGITALNWKLSASNIKYCHETEKEIKFIWANG